MPQHSARLPETVIFLHIPKTAGSTLDQVIYRQYRFHQVYTTGQASQQGVAAIQKMSEAERGKLRLIKGHMTFGIHHYISGPWAYFTFFRDPLERTISYFYYICRAPEHPLYTLIHEQKMDLRQYLEERLDPILYNCHTRLLSGVWDEIPAGACTEEHLEIAKENLNQMKVVGLTEQFDASLLLLGQAFGWKQLYYTQQNVTARRPARRNLPPETMAAVQAANELDSKLYDHAKTLFTQQISRQGPDFMEKVNRFRFNNRLVRPLVALQWEMRKIPVRTIVRQQIARKRH